MGKTTNQLDPVSDSTAANNFQLLPLCDPGTGISEKMTIAQAKAVFGVSKKKYVAAGTEGATLVIAELIGKEVLSVTREGGEIYEVVSSPDPAEFTLDNTTGTVTLGLAVGVAGERFNFLYKTPA
jgi:hypothetical protein